MIPRKFAHGGAANLAKCSMQKVLIARVTHLQIDTCCDIVRCIYYADISANWKTTISLFATPSCSGEIMKLCLHVHYPN